MTHRKFAPPQCTAPIAAADKAVPPGFCGVRADCCQLSAVINKRTMLHFRLISLQHQVNLLFILLILLCFLFLFLFSPVTGSPFSQCFMQLVHMCLARHSNLQYGHSKFDFATFYWLCIQLHEMVTMQIQILRDTT